MILKRELLLFPDISLDRESLTIKSMAPISVALFLFFQPQFQRNFQHQYKITALFGQVEQAIAA